MQAIQTLARRSSTAVLVGSVLTLSASASDLDVTVTSNGQSAITVQPGDAIPYTITGELSNANSQGLGMFTFDLSFDGGDLAQANAPAAGLMLNFATPLGLNNPAGFGGTLVDGDLLQIGGSQNTINNSFAPVPSGMVMTGVALPGSPEVLVTGALTAPSAPGVYTLAVSNVMANALDANTTGFPFWEVEAAEGGTLTQLTLTVQDCTVSTYCTAKVNSQGCLPELAFTGTPTLTGPDDFFFTATNLINGQFGLAFWGLSEGNMPLLGGTLCVGGSLNRLVPRNTLGGGVPGTTCDGLISQNFLQATMIDNNLIAGTEVFAQIFYRDPLHPDGTGAGLSEGIRFIICP